MSLWRADTWLGVPWVWWCVIALCAVMGLFAVAHGALNKVYRPQDGLVSGVVGRMGSGKSLFVVTRVLLPFVKTLERRGGVLRSASGRPMVRVVTNFRFTPPGDTEVVNVQPVPEDGVSVFGSLIAAAYEIGSREGPWYDSDGVLQDGVDSETGLPALMPDGESVPLPNGSMSYVRQPVLNALVVLDEMHLFAGSSKLSLGEEASWVISMARKLNAELWWVSQHEMKVHKRLRDESSALWLCGSMTGLGALLFGSGWHVAREFHSPGLLERARQNPDARHSDKRTYRFTRDARRFYNSFELLIPDPPANGGKRGSAVAPRRAATPEHLRGG